MKMEMKMKNRSPRYDIIHKQFMKKFRNIEAEFKKAFLIKKCLFLS